MVDVLTGSCTSAIGAMEILTDQTVDLIFLDINMPDLNGIDFVKSLVVKPMIVFTTAHSEYAVESFRVDALDYIIKPVTYEAFLESANRAREYYEMRNKKKSESSALMPSVDTEECMFVKSDYKTVRIRFDDITFAESMSEYMRIHLESDPKPIVTLLTMRRLEEILPQNRFLRVHRSYLVNMAKVTEVSRMRIVFDKGVYIPVGDLYKDKFLAFIDRYYVGKD
jgi:DNA-binding LytR/AlgR family response regulator